MDDARARLLDLVRGYRVSQAIYVATRLGIPDLLADGPREIDDLAQATRSHPPSLRRVLLFLAGLGVLDKVGPDRVALTPVAAALRSGVPGSLRPTVLLLLDESHWRPWGHLLHTAQTGETAFEHAHGVGLFDYLAGHPEVASVFNAAMSGNSPAHALVGGSFFDTVPPGGDAYVLRGIIPGFDDDRAVAILTNCRRAMGADARVVLVERHLAADAREALPVLYSDLEMLVNVGGRERTTDEYADLLARSGLRLVRTISLGSSAEAMGQQIIEAHADA